MGRNWITYACILCFSLALLPAVAAGEQPASAAAVAQERPAAGATASNANANSLGNSPSTTSMVSPWTGAPLAYSASRSVPDLRVEDLMRGGAALREQGNFSKAMELYNRALAIAPQYAEGYRQRALTLVGLGDRVQAQIDYNHFLALDPQATARAQQEVVLFKQSGRGQLGEAEAAAYSYGPTTVAGAWGWPIDSDPMRQLFADDRYSLADSTFKKGDYDAALMWATNSLRNAPHARTHALLAQILFAQGDFRGAAAEARTAIAMRPAIDWRTLFAYYSYATPRFSRQLHSLEEFVRDNPSSADAHFLLGYEQLVLGKAEAAHAQLAIASVIEPNDVAATALLAKDGVEVVSSHRPLLQAAAPPAGMEVARRLPTPPIGIGPWPQPASGISAPQGTTQPEIVR